MGEKKTLKRRSHYIGDQLYASMDAAGRISLPVGVLPYKGYRVVWEGDDVQVIPDDYYSFVTNTRITIGSQIRNRLNLKPNCIFKVEKQIVNGEERLILKKVEDESIKW